MLHPFDYHRPDESQIAEITKVREGCKALFEILNTLPPCRERSLAHTKLEEVSMWANKGIVMHVSE